jgi:hypothetical protein
MSVIYPLAKQSFLSQSPALDWDTDNIKVSLVSASYTYSASHQYYTDLGANVIASSSNLGTKTVALGVAGAATVTFTTPPAGSVCRLVVWKDTGTPATSPLICLIDTGTGLPVTTNGGDITVTWNVAGIFGI